MMPDRWSFILRITGRQNLIIFLKISIFVDPYEGRPYDNLYGQTIAIFQHFAVTVNISCCEIKIVDACSYINIVPPIPNKTF